MRESYELKMERSLHDHEYRPVYTPKAIKKQEKRKLKNLPLPFWLFIVLLAILLNSKFSILLLVLIFVAFLVAKYTLKGSRGAMKGGTVMMI